MKSSCLSTSNNPLKNSRTAREPESDPPLGTEHRGVRKAILPPAFLLLGCFIWSGYGSGVSIHPLAYLAQAKQTQEIPAGGGIRALYRSMQQTDRTAEDRGTGTDRKEESTAGSQASARIRSSASGVEPIPQIPRPEDLRFDSSKKGKDASDSGREKKTGVKAATRPEKLRSDRDERQDKNQTSKKRTERSRTKKKSARSDSGFPTALTPTPRGGYRYRTPKFYRGIYLTNMTIRDARRYRQLLKEARAAGINTLVVDVQPRLPSIKFMRYARTSDFYMVARVVVFPGGLKDYPPSSETIAGILNVSERAVRRGFMEVQFDYIRFADQMGEQKGSRLSLRKRYRLIEGILKMGTDRLRPLGVRVGADIFGRIAFNRNDIIGQKIELFAAHLDTIYPMLYPSHFYGEPFRIRNPYKTILDGQKNCISRSEGQSRIIAYIQGFKMSVKESGLSLNHYIQKQIQAAADSGGAGYIVWNARNHYRSTFEAMKLQKKPDKEGDGKSPPRDTALNGSRREAQNQTGVEKN